MRPIIAISIRRDCCRCVIDGGRRYIQSMATIEYLDEAYPEPPLMPRDINERAYVRAVSQIIGCEMHPLNNVRVLKHLKSTIRRR